MMKKSLKILSISAASLALTGAIGIGSYFAISAKNHEAEINQINALNQEANSVTQNGILNDVAKLLDNQKFKFNNTLANVELITQQVLSLSNSLSKTSYIMYQNDKLIEILNNYRAITFEVKNVDSTDKNNMIVKLNLKLNEQIKEVNFTLFHEANSSQNNGNNNDNNADKNLSVNQQARKLFDTLKSTYDKKEFAAKGLTDKNPSEIYAMVLTAKTLKDKLDLIKKMIDLDERITLDNLQNISLVKPSERDSTLTLEINLSKSESFQVLRIKITGLKSLYLEFFNYWKTFSNYLEVHPLRVKSSKTSDSFYNRRVKDNKGNVNFENYFSLITEDIIDEPENQRIYEYLFSPLPIEYSSLIKNKLKYTIEHETGLTDTHQGRFKIIVSVWYANVNYTAYGYVEGFTSRRDFENAERIKQEQDKETVEQKMNNLRTLASNKKSLVEKEKSLYSVWNELRKLQNHVLLNKLYPLITDGDKLRTFVNQGVLNKAVLKTDFIKNSAGVYDASKSVINLELEVAYEDQKINLSLAFNSQKVFATTSEQRAFEQS
ncbi:hypothetical protein [Mycoplasmopsis agassizii]|uniref:Uncharacterized protein n=2 Tax=Mycoplasmopsis agassizii TaxID=33922 RepID=A0ABX4H5S3_9BACT|nr:hypothetical protein [Mycoplasmopsis agassizii]PAF55252.1 hypothetical protein CJF60_01015 [Mycoplasmopsis agassizii]